jgi:FkbM family methyltransferase
MENICGLMKGIMRRLRLLFFYCFKKEVRMRVTSQGILRAVFAPCCENIAPRYSAVVREDSKYIYYTITGERDIFSYPRELPYHNFAQVISEGCQKDHFHYYELPQTKIEYDDVVADCGSAEGFFAYKYRRNCQHIYCIEPLPVFCRALHKLFDTYNNVTIVEAALSDNNGRLYLSPSSTSSTCKSEITDLNNDIPVEAVTMDSLFADKGVVVNFIKGDLEGFEEKMIIGSLKTIKMFKPKIALTTYHPGTNYKKIVDVIRHVVPEYQYLLKGVEESAGNPVMLHMWVE